MHDFHLTISRAPYTIERFLTVNLLMILVVFRWAWAFHVSFKITITWKICLICFSPNIKRFCEIITSNHIQFLVNYKNSSNCCYPYLFFFVPLQWYFIYLNMLIIFVHVLHLPFYNSEGKKTCTGQYLLWVEKGL